MPDAVVALGDGKRVVGRLRFESDGRRQHSQFEYASGWLESSDRFALSPGLPLREGGHFSAARGERRTALPGRFQDAAPDSWGRALMTRALGGGLTEFDFLTQSDDVTRHGALRFLDADLEPLSRLSPPVPRVLELERLRQLAHRFERNPDRVEQEIHELAGVAGSLGGARPKASVQGEGHLWMARFTSADDRRTVERAEIATLYLAGKSGIRVPEARLELPESDSPIALIRRFDRRGATRIPYMSARTALDLTGTDPGHYTDIADVIRQVSARPRDDLEEFWSRIVFTVLVSNADDPLQNHGFIYVGKGFWRLSPAFDINPAPLRRRTLQTGILEGEPFDAFLELAPAAAVSFGIDARDAERRAGRMSRRVKRGWKSAFRAQGASAGDVRDYAAAFEHDDMARACRLKEWRSVRPCSSATPLLDRRSRLDALRGDVPEEFRAGIAVRVLPFFQPDRRRGDVCGTSRSGHDHLPSCPGSTSSPGSVDHVIAARCRYVNANESYYFIMPYNIPTDTYLRVDGSGFHRPGSPAMATGPGHGRRTP